MLEPAQKNNFEFDTVQMPLDVMDAHFRSFTKLVVPQAQKMGLGGEAPNVQRLGSDT
jgi:hypothetical protein